MLNFAMTEMRKHLILKNLIWCQMAVLTDLFWNLTLCIKVPNRNLWPAEPLYVETLGSGTYYTHTYYTQLSADNTFIFKSQFLKDVILTHIYSEICGLWISSRSGSGSSGLGSGIHADCNGNSSCSGNDSSGSGSRKWWQEGRRNRSKLNDKIK